MLAGFTFVGRRVLIALCLCMAFVSSVPARASLLWNWSYSGAGISASGTLTTEDTANAGGQYLIIGITGSRNGVAITGLQAPGTSIPGNEPFVVDNLISAGAP